MKINFMELINNDRGEHGLVWDKLGIDLDIDRIAWVRGLTNMDKAEEIFEIYLKECYNTSMQEINAAMENVQRTPYGWCETKEINLEE